MVAARARASPVAWSGRGSSAVSPSGFTGPPGTGGSASRVAWRTASWLDNTQVAGAPTARFASSDARITVRRVSASQRAVRKPKLNAWCNSSWRTYRASRGGSTQASATSMRSPS